MTNATSAKLQKDTYIQVRVNSAVKSILKRFAEERNETLSQFILQAAVKALETEGREIRIETKISLD